MSKKQNQKKKVTVKVSAGQAVFVADLLVLEHIAELYRSMAFTSEDPDSWMVVADSIIDWASKTYVPEGESYDEEEW